jgi:uncharacterized protein YqgC (DUF456 family)
MNIFLIAAFLLLVAGMVGSVIPAMPGALLSLSGVLLYWWSTGFSSPGDLFVVLSVVFSLGAAVFDWVAGALTARAGGASRRSSVAAALAGFLGFFVGGPVGTLVLSTLAVGASEYNRHGRSEDAGRAALYSALGMVASVGLQLAVTISMFLAFVSTLVL